MNQDDSSINSATTWAAYSAGNATWGDWVEARLHEERSFGSAVLAEVLSTLSDDLNRQIEKGIVELRLAARVQDGADGRSFRIRSTFNPRERYKALDVVALNGASFVAQQDDPGPCPGDNWQLLCSQGKKGQAGRDGVDGRAGRDAPRITEWLINRESYSVIPIMSDGSRGPPLELRPLFARFFAETEGAPEEIAP
jgi:hypothetical protein